MNETPASETTDAPETAELSYEGNRVPWYVPAMWVTWLAVFGVYWIAKALPSIRRMLAETKFDSFPF